MSWNSPWSQSLTHNYGLTEENEYYTSASADNNQSFPIKGDYSGDLAYYYNGSNWVSTGCYKMVPESYQGTNPYGRGLNERN